MICNFWRNKLAVIFRVGFHILGIYQICWCSSFYVTLLNFESHRYAKRLRSIFLQQWHCQTVLNVHRHARTNNRPTAIDSIVPIPLSPLIILWTPCRVRYCVFAIRLARYVVLWRPVVSHPGFPAGVIVRDYSQCDAWARRNLCYTYGHCTQLAPGYCR
jgi:hypothetical protein